MMKLITKVVACSLLGLGMIAGCSADDAAREAHISGVITVADSVNSTGDFSGIGVTIINKDSADAAADTLFEAHTDKDGKFSGIAEFEYRRQYAMVISRNGQTLGQAGIILAERDTVSVSGEIPGLAQTLTIHSREHDALATYRRVNRSFQRISAYAQAGRLKGDSLVTELRKWPGLYWQIHKQHPGTIAGNLAARKSIELLNAWDKPAMMEKIREIQDDEDLVVLAAIYGKDYLAETEGLNYSLAYLDTLHTDTRNRQALMRIEMERIDLLYDSAKVQKAQAALQSFKEDFNEEETAKKWAESVAYDLNYLSPGDAIPEFSFSYNGTTISREKLKGSPYLLEITSLTSPVYQQQYDRTVVIYGIYKNYNFQVLTIPLDTSEVTVEGFFEQRVKPWPVAPAKAFDRDELLKKFNISNVPTRFLVDSQGRIVRRYVGQEYRDVIQGIQQIMNKQ